MKKISYLSLLSYIEVITVTMYFDTSIYILKESISYNSWLAVIISIIIGFIPILLIIYISNYQENKNIFEKINSLFGSTSSKVINFIIALISFIIASSLLYNTCDFIISQFLYHTPILISMILLTSLIVYNNTKGINVMSKVSFILIVINMLLFSTSFLSQLGSIKFDNFLPLLKEDIHGFIPTTIKIISINTLPLFITLVIPKQDITKSDKYNKIVIIAYLIGSLIAFLTTIQTYGVLGKYLVKIFEYPEYIILKKIKLFGFIERVENIISSEWIIGSFIYISLLVYTISKSIYPNKNSIPNYIYIIIGTLLIITTRIIFKDNTTLSSFNNNIFSYITSLLFPIYILITVKIFVTKKKIWYNHIGDIYDI